MIQILLGRQNPRWLLHTSTVTERFGIYCLSALITSICRHLAMVFVKFAYLTKQDLIAVYSLYKEKLHNFSQSRHDNV